MWPQTFRPGGSPWHASSPTDVPANPPRDWRGRRGTLPAGQARERPRMNRRELVNAIAAHSGMETRHVDACLKATTDVITAVVAKGEPVAISGFAKFAKVERSARMGRNPQTGEPVKIKASKKARITPLKGFKDAVMTPSTAPKLGTGVWPPAAKKAAPAK